MLRKKMIRDIKNNLSQFITIFLMVFIGVLVYAGIASYMDGMVNSANKYYKKSNLQDLNIISKSITKENLDQIKKMDHVKDVERKITVMTTEKGKKDRTIQLNFIETNNISKFHVFKGEKFDADKKGIWVDNFYAENNNIKIGDEITLTYEGVTLKEKVVGIINVPDHVYDIKDEFINKMKEEEQLELFSNIEMKLSYVLASMEIEGVRVDTKVLDEMGENINKKLDELTSEIYNYAGEEFNIQSPKQLGEILFEKLEIPYPKKKKTSYSTAREILDKIVDYHPIVEKIIEHRTLNKIYTTYIVGIKNCVKEDGKLHTIYTQTLTRTGRLSSIEPNLQNIPIRYKEGKEIRKAFIPEENSVFLSSDYSQIELRMFAHMSGEQNLIDAFKHHLDIHTKTAMDIYHVSKDEVTKNMRRDAKAVNFGIIYGISSFGLAEDLGVDIKTAKKFLDNYLETFPGIKNYMDKVIKDAYETGYVKTIMNRKRKIDELYNTNHMIKVQGERMALNTPVQGSSADILKKAMIDIYNEFNRLNLKSKMILQVHDELIFNVKNDELEKVKEIVINFMENAYKLNVPLEVDVEIGKNWYDAK